MWADIQEQLQSTAKQCCKLYTGRFPPRLRDSTKCRAGLRPAKKPILAVSEKLVYEDAVGVSKDKRVAALRDLLAARGVRGGYKEFLACAENPAHKRHRLALTVLALEHEEMFSIHDVEGNPYFQGPFYVEPRR